MAIRKPQRKVPQRNTPKRNTPPTSSKKIVLQRIRSQRVIDLAEQVVDIDTQIEALKESIRALEFERQARVDRLHQQVGQSFLYIAPDGHMRQAEFELTPPKKILDRTKVEATYAKYGWKLPYRNAKRSLMFKVYEVSSTEEE